MACDVVAWRDRVVADRIGANEADLDVTVATAVLGLVLDLETLRLTRLWPLGCRLRRGILRAVVMPAAPTPPRAASASRVVSPAAASSPTSPPSAPGTVAAGT